MDWPSTNRGRGERRVCRRGAPHHGGRVRSLFGGSSARDFKPAVCTPCLPHTPFSSPFRSSTLTRALRLYRFRRTFQRRGRTPFGVSAPRFSPGRRLKNRTVIYGTALDRGIPLMGCLNVSILSLILLTRAGFRSGHHAFEMLSPGGVTTIVNRGYTSD